MTRIGSIFAGLLAASTLFTSCYAQAPTPVIYTDPKTSIVFDTWSVPGGSNETESLTFGMSLPSKALKSDSPEFIGYLRCAPGTGWCGIALGGSMTNGLLLVAYADGNTVRTSLRFTSKYAMPALYTGNATVIQISSSVNATAFSAIFRCKDCLHWSQNGTSGAASTSSGILNLGYAQSREAPINPSCPAEAHLVKHDKQGTWVAYLEQTATTPHYSNWATLASHTVTDRCSSVNTTTTRRMLARQRSRLRLT